VWKWRNGLRRRWKFGRSPDTRHVHEPIRGTKGLDELRVCHPAFAADLSGLALGQGRTRPRAAMPITLLITTRHRTQL
jgi:hypothetical protein